MNNYYLNKSYYALLDVEIETNEVNAFNTKEIKFCSGLYEFQNIFFDVKSQKLYQKNNEIFTNIFNDEDILDHSFFNQIDGAYDEVGLSICSDYNNYFHLMFELIFSLRKIGKYKNVPLYYKRSNNKAICDFIDSEFTNQVNFENKVFISKAFVPFFNFYFESKSESEEWKKYAYSYDFINYLNLAIKIPISNTSKRIFISRNDASFRNLVNYNEVKRLLDEFDFEEVSFSNKSLLEQAIIVSSANIIVAVHGAANTNFVFCREGAKVLELFNDVYKPMNFQIISEIKGAEYSKLTFPDIDTELDKFKKDIYVNVENLKEVILDLLHRQ